MRAGLSWAVVVMVVVLGCKDKEAESVRDKQLELERAKEQAAKQQLDQAEAEAAKAVKEAQEAKDQLEQIMKDLDAVNQKLSAAVDAAANAQSDADRDAAKSQLAALQKEQAELKARVEAARAAAAKADRVKGVTISKECMDNPLAKGC